jgi:peptidyl-prolyl cis-trans isomerase B (cyclophilin B)
MKNFACLFIIVAAAMAASASAQTSFNGKPRYEILVKCADTVMGKITVEMFPAIAPNHVRNWDSLVTIKFYDSIAFHRVIPGFVIQGGDPNSRSGPRDTWGYGDPDQQTVDAEFSSVSHRRGILSAARLGNDINSATSQFFICVATAANLDHQYSIYGHVTSGMNIADTIVNAPRDGNDNPYDKISMFITRTGTNDSVTAVPELVSPMNDSVLAAVAKTPVRWHKVSDAMLYRLQVATDAAFTTITLDTNLRQIDTSFTVTKLVSGKEYYWRVLANNGGIPSEYSSPWKFTNGTLSVHDNNAPQQSFDIYPNPVTEDATISFDLNGSSRVSITVIDLLGRSIRDLSRSEYLAAGSHQITFHRANLSAGVYFCRLEANGSTSVKRIVIN